MPLTTLANNSDQLSLVLNYLNRTASFDEHHGLYVYSFPDSPYCLVVVLTGDVPEAHWCLPSDPYNRLYAGQVAVTSYKQLVALCRTIRQGRLPQVVYPYTDQLAS
jgi:hypothetical protein